MAYLVTLGSTEKIENKEAFSQCRIGILKVAQKLQ
jgi:hypothetical protein